MSDDKPIDKYAHLFPEDAPKRAKPPKAEPAPIAEPVTPTHDGPSTSYFRFETMHATRLITFVHGLTQVVLIVVGCVGFMFFLPHIGFSFLLLVAVCIASLIFRVSCELTVVIFRILEELVATRKGIDEFNSKVRAAKST